MATTINHLSHYAALYPFQVTLLSWLFWPGSMILTARYLEDRTVIISGKQKELLFPNNLMLGLIFTNLLLLSKELRIEYTNSYLAITAAITAAILVRKLRHHKATLTASGITYIICGRFVTPWLISSLVVHVVYTAISEHATGNSPLLLATLFLFFIIFTISTIPE